MSMTTNSQYEAPLKEFKVETEMRDVEILRLSPSRILARGKRFGRVWLLRGLPSDMRNDPGLLRELREEFDRRFDCLEPDVPLTVGIEEIKGLGPCIVEEWREDYHILHSVVEKGESRSPKHRLSLRCSGILIIAFIAIVGSLASGFYIRRLTVASETAKADLETLRLANRQGEERMYVLADSLDRVLSDSLIQEKFESRVEIMEENKDSRMADALYKVRIKEFEQELVRYDRFVIPEAIDNLPVFYDSICALYRCMMDKAVDVDPYWCFPQIPEDERIRITSQLYGGYMQCALNYMRVWIPKARAAYEKKRNNALGRKDG